MLTDPFLKSHQVEHLWFDIGGSLSPVSIRDQMIRGRMLVERAVACQLLKVNPAQGTAYPLLVIGAGAGGVTAAIRAVELGIPVRLVDTAGEAFALQKKCASRRVCPTQYDWPVPHWNQARFPWEALKTEPLTWRRDRAEAIAIGWKSRLDVVSKRYKRLLTIALGNRVTKADFEIRPDSKEVDRIRVSFQPPGNSPEFDDTFGMVLSCIGFGDERTMLPPETNSPFEGIDFWDNDYYEEINCGVPADRARIVVSGSGDGALQDFLRVVSGMPYVADIYHQFVRKAEELTGAEYPAFLLALRRMESEVEAAEEQAQRLLAIASVNEAQRRVEEHGVYTQLEAKHVQALNVLRNSYPEVVVEAALSTIRKPVPEVTLIHPCRHFTANYGLNRFVTLLLREVLKSKGVRRVYKRVRFRRERRVIQVQSADPQHQCMVSETPEKPDSEEKRKLRKACHGKVHRVIERVWDCNTEKDGRIPASKWRDKDTRPARTANVIILRHGVQGFEDELKIKLSKDGKDVQPLPRRHQLMPYHPMDITYPRKKAN